MAIHLTAHGDKLLPAFRLESLDLIRRDLVEGLVPEMSQQGDAASFVTAMCRGAACSPSDQSRKFCIAALNVGITFGSMIPTSCFARAVRYAASISRATRRFSKSAGIPLIAGTGMRVRGALRILRKSEWKRVIRGHFEAWFFVAYLKRMLEVLNVEAGKHGGSVSMFPQVEQTNLIALTVSWTEIPPELDEFLILNLNE